MQQSKQGDFWVVVDGAGKVISRSRVKQVINDEDTNSKLVESIMSLDPHNDVHWTKHGLPALRAVEAFYGDSSIIRADVEKAVPGWNRATALERSDAKD